VGRGGCIDKHGKRGVESLTLKKGIRDCREKNFGTGKLARGKILNKQRKVKKREGEVSGVESQTKKEKKETVRTAKKPLKHQGTIKKKPLVKKKSSGTRWEPVKRRKKTTNPVGKKRHESHKQPGHIESEKRKKGQNKKALDRLVVKKRPKIAGAGKKKDRNPEPANKEGGKTVQKRSRPVWGGGGRVTSKKTTQT